MDTVLNIKFLYEFKSPKQLKKQINKQHDFRFSLAKEKVYMRL